MDWLLIGGDSGRSGVRGDTPGPGTGEILWQVTTREAVAAQPAYADGLLYVTSGGWDTGGAVYALDAKTGRVVWVQETDPIRVSPAIADGIVVIATRGDENRENGAVIAYEAKTGDFLWQQPMKGFVTMSPTIHEGIVYTGDGHTWIDEVRFHAFNLHSGEVLWTIDTLGGLDDASYVEGNLVVVGGGNSEILYALDRLTGEPKWEQPTTARPGGGPTVVEGVVVAGSDDRLLFALDAATGTPLWTFKSTVNWLTPPPSILDGVVYAPMGTVYALDLHHGNLLWSYPGHAISFIAVDDDIMYVSGYRMQSDRFNPDPYDYHIQAVNGPTGHVHWEHHLGQHVYAGPIVVDGILYQGYGEYDSPLWERGVIALDAGYLAHKAALEERENPELSVPFPPAPLVVLLMAYMLALVRRRNQMV